MSGYARPELLAETDWLAERLDDPSLRIVDCDEWPAHQRAHIPGAAGLRVHHYLKDPDNPEHVMPPSLFEQLMGELGIGNDTLVVAYDAFGGLYAARLWWALDYYGHTKAKVLNGGWLKWLAEGRPVTNRIPEVAPARFQARPGSDCLCTLDHLLGSIGREDAVIWDVRTRAEHTGEDPRQNKYGGRIPGAVHLEWRDLITGDVKVWKAAEELRGMLEGLGITPEKEVITQ
ncbi:MAG: sulfurtransferase [Chloroflexi bacterium]|nr:sulfurtransferase [Chloroflexota bacterium]